MCEDLHGRRTTHAWLKVDATKTYCQIADRFLAGEPKSTNSVSHSDELAEDDDEHDQENDHGVDNVANEEEDVEMVDEMVDVVKSM